MKRRFSPMAPICRHPLHLLYFLFIRPRDSPFPTMLTPLILCASVATREIVQSTANLRGNLAKKPLKPEKTQTKARRHRHLNFLAPTLAHRHKKLQTINRYCPHGLNDMTLQLCTTSTAFYMLTLIPIMVEP
ncbi:uncharacterized protein BO95DRAFT_229025 [Aspergillus brunneoviolaceus CBS 621.78]|uniref:Uncharacterized protein n=1 Tax=Aspergillus brunneoviolaceus CBS 621.78 TaxID=1450534 RepID=A0ACD1G0D4_9EURO|nr:hypothetical protein BO95DRAFT_229025 [Aspergillus brunneoviolaceus CBS 621.78]RAH42653.1 hypothetical protein BO95DRAFT_229025 [Aspergillus brunneoviolaceus CBS 621.78]